MAFDPPDSFIRSIGTGLVSGLRALGLRRELTRDEVQRIAKDVARTIAKDGWTLDPKRKPPSGGVGFVHKDE